MLKLKREAYFPDTVRNIQHIPFNTCLVAEPPVYDRGRKVSVSYFADKAMTDLVVSKSFQDEMTEGNLSGLLIDFSWFNEDGSVGLRKSVFKPLSSIDSQEHLKKRRARALATILSDAIRSGQSRFIGMLFSHYSDELSSWEFSGESQALVDALMNERDGTTAGILLAPTSDPEDGYENIRSYLVGQLGL